MASLKDISTRHIRELIGNFTNTKVTPSGGSQTGIDTTQTVAAALQPTIDGKPGVLKANLSNVAFAALAALQNPITGQDGFYVQPASTTVYYLFVLNLAGTFYTIQGNYTGRSIPRPGGRNGLGVSEIPDIAVPYTYAPFGAMRIITGTSAFTLGTTNTNATTGGMAVTFTSFSKIPAGLPTFA